MAQTDVVVFGNSGCGKSTLCGRIVYQYGEFDDKALTEAKAATKKLNKPNSEYAFLCDIREEDRKNGTSTNHLLSFIFSRIQYTLIDSCAASKNQNHLIRHALGQSRVGLLILEAYSDTNTFKSLIDNKSDIRQQLVIAHAFGVHEIAICINKIDKENINFTQELYNEYKQSIFSLLSSIGYNPNKVPIIPICSYSADNLFESSIDPSLKWWNLTGIKIKTHTITTVMQAVQYLSKKAVCLNAGCSSNVSLCMSIKSRMEIKKAGTVFLARVDAGELSLNQTVLCCKSGQNPSARKYKINSLQIHNKNIASAKCGAVVGFTLVPDINELDKKEQPQVEDMLFNGDKFKLSIIGRDKQQTNYIQALPDGVRYYDVFTALIIMLPEDIIGKQRMEINRKEFNNALVFRTQTLNGSLSQILAKCKEKDNELQASSGFNELTNGDQAEVVFSTKDMHFVSTYKEMNTYSRFVIMKDKKAIAIGKIIAIGNKQEDALKDGLYRFEAAHSSKYIAVKDNSKEKGKELVQYERCGKDNELFYVKKEKNGFYTIKCKHSGLFWKIENESKDDSASLIQAEFDASDSQYFEITHIESGMYGIKAKQSQKSLDVNGGSKENDAKIIQYTTHNNANQLFFCVK